jgi:hypothetical protein
VGEARQRLAAIDEERERQKRRCDELAANPNDQNRRRTSRGVSYDELKTHITEAIRACELAVQLLPADLTLQYQLARAVELADPARGQAMQDRLVKLSYPAAFDNAGSLLLNEKGCRQHCINEAVKLFRKGVALGDPDAMMSLADQIGQNHATGDQISLYQRAAKLGHPRAIRALEALAQERMPPPMIFRPSHARFYLRKLRAFSTTTPQPRGQPRGALQPAEGTNGRSPIFQPTAPKASKDQSTLGPRH